MAKIHFESRIAEKWFRKANEYEPKSETDYEWVWDYAKFRLAWATERVQHVEGKALEFLKFVLAAAAAGWGALTLLGAKLYELSNKTAWCLGVSSLFLMASIVYTLRAYLPTKRLLPIAEDAALRCADSYQKSSEAMGKFAQTLSCATEYETNVAGTKANQLWLAACFLAVAAVLFLGAISLGVHH